MSLEIKDIQAKCDTIVKLVEKDILTIDEARQELGFPPLADEMGRFTHSLYLNFVENIEGDFDDEMFTNRIHLN